VLEIGSGVGEWLLLGSVGTAGSIIADVEDRAAGEFVNAVDLTHGRALTRITGADSPALLAKVCAVDLDDEVTPDLSAFYSSVAKVVTNVVREDLDGTRSNLLHCDRSSGQFLFDVLRDAGAEFGLEVAGFTDDREAH
jgi:heterotetrameric sarcosine oxidase gamma subunit